MSILNKGLQVKTNSILGKILRRIINCTKQPLLGASQITHTIEVVPQSSDWTQQSLRQITCYLFRPLIRNDLGKGLSTDSVLALKESMYCTEQESLAKPTFFDRACNSDTLLAEARAIRNRVFIMRCLILQEDRGSKTLDIKYLNTTSRFHEIGLFFLLGKSFSKALIRVLMSSSLPTHGCTEEITAL